ncbi:hypothetical protein FIV38_05350 [Pseudomonas proteolytica]|nr:hypothetical protein F4W61_13080 [Pseudomonas proteolytica]TWR84916.1 hypothetical protein FIV38_05350 [Pseudomonas proteolytica]
MLAKSVNDHAPSLSQRGALTFFASKLAPTELLIFRSAASPAMRRISCVTALSSFCHTGSLGCAHE